MCVVYRFAAYFLLVIFCMAPEAFAADPGSQLLSPRDAHERSTAGDLLLVDIRSIEEWKKTGIAANARPLTMHQSATGFLNALDALTGKDKNRPIALICATGGRSAFLLRYLKKQGYTQVFDVGAGMLGSRHGNGWLRAKLPVKPYE